MEQADMGIDAPDHLTVQFQYEAQHSVCRRVLRSKIHCEIAERSFGHAGLVSPLVSPDQTPGIFTGSADALIGHILAGQPGTFRLALVWLLESARDGACRCVLLRENNQTKQDVRNRKLI
jgi:hypothetical protein